MEFRKVKLKEVIEFKNGKKRPNEDGNIPIYGGNGILGYTNKSNSQQNSIIIGRVGAYCGCVYKNDNECWVSDNAIVGYAKENNSYLYLYYCLKSLNLNNLHIGSGHPLMTQDILNNIKIKIPHYNIQLKIGKILENIDKKIELNNQINDNLLKLNNQLYEEYFINNINENADEINLKDLINVVNGYSYKGSELTDESEVGLATIKNFERKGGFKEDGFKPLNPQKIKENQIVEKNDILVACTDLTQQADIIGNAVLLLGKAEYEKVIISMDLVKIIPKENIDKYVIFSILNSREFKNFALGYKSGTTVLHLNKKCFDDFIIRIPANDKLDIFSKMVKTNYEKISNILEENRRLEKLRDALLPKLMNGEIDLDKIEI